MDLYMETAGCRFQCNPQLTFASVTDQITFLAAFGASEQWQFLTNGLFSAGGATTVYPALRRRGTTFETRRADDSSITTHIIANKTKAGVPVDADFTGPVDGILALNTSNSHLYGRSGAAWVDLTGAGGSSTWTEVEVDFGSKPRSDGKFTVTDGTVGATSKVIVLSSGKTATGRKSGDDQWDSIVYAALPATGTFTVYAHATGRVRGKRKIQYQVAA